MKKALRYALWRTAAGWVGVLASGEGLQRSTLPQPSAGEALKGLGGEISGSERCDSYFRGLMERLSAYFEGRSTAFPDASTLPA